MLPISEVLETILRDKFYKKNWQIMELLETLRSMMTNLLEPVQSSFMEKKEHFVLNLRVLVPILYLTLKAIWLKLKVLISFTQLDFSSPVTPVLY